MGKKRLNSLFLEAYVELDKQCAALFEMYSGGVNEYINNLMIARYIYGRDETVNRLVKYKGIRNRLAHEAGALKGDMGITKEDIRWIKKFSKKVYKGKDPISEHKAKFQRGKIRRFTKKFIFLWFIIDVCTIAAGIWAAIEIFFKSKRYSKIDV